MIRSTTGRIMYCSIPKPCCITVRNVICLPKGRIAVIDGLKGFVVAEKGDVLMICPKDDSAALRRMMTDAQMKLGEEFI